MSLNESTVDTAALEQFGKLGYAVGNGSHAWPKALAGQEAAVGSRRSAESLGFLGRRYLRLARGASKMLTEHFEATGSDRVSVEVDEGQLRRAVVALRVVSPNPLCSTALNVLSVIRVSVYLSARLGRAPRLRPCGWHLDRATALSRPAPLPGARPPLRR